MFQEKEKFQIAQTFILSEMKETESAAQWSGGGGDFERSHVTGTNLKVTDKGKKSLCLLWKRRRRRKKKKKEEEQEEKKKKEEEQEEKKKKEEQEEKKKGYEEKKKRKIIRKRQI